MPRLHLALLLIPLAGLAPSPAATAAAEASRGGTLAAPEAFKSIADKRQRSAALFVEAGKVLTHPRCVNCHPAGDVPLQGETGDPHEPPVRRGRSGLGVAGLECVTCHQRENFDPGRMPGAPAWHLAPRSMAWEGLGVAEICEQLKDPERNGNRDLAAIVEHMAEDALVGWAWAPGAGREPPPGDQETFGALIAAWAKSGAVCPADSGGAP